MAILLKSPTRRHDRSHVAQGVDARNGFEPKWRTIDDPMIMMVMISSGDGAMTMIFICFCICGAMHGSGYRVCVHEACATYMCIKNVTHANDPCRPKCDHGRRLYHRAYTTFRANAVASSCSGLATSRSQRPSLQPWILSFFLMPWTLAFFCFGVGFQSRACT